LRRLLPNGRFEAVPDSGSRPGPLRNVVGAVQGRDPVRLVVVGAHYDTKDAPGLVGANDGAGGTAAVVQLARSIRPRQLGPTVVFVLFDGEESPAGTPERPVPAAWAQRQPRRRARVSRRRGDGAARLRG
jgi:Predicted aminopeptidases